MISLKDGRAELFQWDTGRVLSVPEECTQVHFSNKIFGRSIDVEVVDGEVLIPDVLLQTSKDITVWAFVGTAENGYTKISKVFKVNERNKPADYVFTPTEQMTLEKLTNRITAVEEIATPENIEKTVENYLQENPVESAVTSVNGQTGDVKITAESLGALTDEDLQSAIDDALAQAKESGEFDGEDGQDGVDGTSVSVVSIEVSPEDGGKNIVTFSDGTTLTVLNGTKGSRGMQGASVTVSQVGESVDDGGENIVKFSDGTILTVRNGSKGSQGEQGIQGKKGEPGQKGEQGIQGIPGEKGDKGDTGEKGDPGKDGVNGVTPHVGSNGNWFIGDNDTGIPATGPAGGQGLPGTPGEDGKDGTSATHSWDGTVLTVTSASGTSSADLKGEKGDKGEQGIQGKKGERGEQGVQGVQGIQGIQGEKGSDGAKGDKGDKGDKGEKGDPYTLTEADKAEIVRMVIESLGGNPIFGYVDENNNIIVSGNLADGSYSVKYEMENGSTVDIGNLVLDTNVYYSVTNNLTNCTSDNGASKVVEGESYIATITANDGYELKSVSATMGGSAVSVSGGVINIASVTGNIVITAVAEETQTEPTEPTNFAEPNATNTTDWSIWCNDARFGSDGSYRPLTDQNNAVTNYIPVEVGDVLYITGMNIPTTGTSMNQGLLFADVNKNMCSASYLLWYIDDTGNDYIDMESTDSVPYILDTAKMANHPKGALIKYVRISGKVTGTLDDVVINVKRNGEWL